jgi:hypothetical protein
MEPGGSALHAAGPAYAATARKGACGAPDELTRLPERGGAAQDGQHQLPLEYFACRGRRMADRGQRLS